MSLTSNNVDHDASRRLTRASRQRVLAGVCAGISEYLGISLVFTRIIFVLLSLANGIGVLIYIVLIFVIPAGPREVQVDTAAYYPPPSSGKTFFKYVLGIIGTGAVLVTALNNLAVILDFIARLTG